MVSKHCKARVKRVSKFNKNKVKKIKKGFSSSSNPELKRYRDAAKSRFFNFIPGTGNLTRTALEKHNEETSAGATTAYAGIESQDGKSVASFLTNFTECTNVSFSKVHRYWQSNSASHKEILAILAAVTEVIKLRGGKETETEYLAALMTALESVDNEESMTAVLYLISLVIKRTPSSVLKLKFSAFSQVFVNILVKHVNTSSASLLRSAIVSLAAVLRVQEQAVWSDSSTIQLYRAILNFTAHSKPKVRKAAHHAVLAILKGSIFMTQENSPDFHPAAVVTGKFCTQQIVQSGGIGEATETLHSLELLKDVLSVLPSKSLKPACETILRVLTLSNALVKAVSMKALHCLFQAKPKETCLTPELNAQLINALYDYQPGDNDIQPMSAWLTAMESAHINLSRINAKQCIHHLPKIVQTMMSCFLSDRPEITNATSSTLKTLLQECFRPAKELVVLDFAKLHASGTSVVQKIFSSVEKGLSYQYHASWGHILQLLTLLFQIMGKECHSIMRKCLQSLADLRDTNQFSYTHDLDYAIGAAVRSMGPKLILTAVPLQIDGTETSFEFSRSWLLPVLRDNVRDTELSFFVQYFLPLAAKLRNRSLECIQEDKQVEGKTYSILHSQIWSLLPGFCTCPTDLCQSFGGLAKILGHAVADWPELRSDVLSAIRLLINKNIENQQNSQELAKYAKNYLPIFFNIITTEPNNKKAKDSSHLATLETVKCYLQITPKDLVDSLFERACSKFKDQGQSTFQRHALMDLIVAMVPYISLSHITQAYDLVTGLLESNDLTEQKKSYRILEEVCSAKSDACNEFVIENLSDLEKLLSQMLSSAAPSSKPPRLKCLTHIVNRLEQEHRNFIISILPEVIMCTKEGSERARTAAFKLLTEIGSHILNVKPEQKTDQERLTEYFELLSAGLGGNPHMVGATILAITTVMFSFKGKLEGSVLEALLDNMCLLLESKSREVIVSVLSFIKVTISITKTADLTQHLKQIIDSINGMCGDTRRHFRFKIKVIFTKLVKKFGFELVNSMASEDYHKMLVNIRKLLARAKRKKDVENDEESVDDDEDAITKHTAHESIDDILRDTDSELEDDQSEKRQKVRDRKWRKKEKKSSAAAWIKEETGDIVDFLDPGTSKKILATQPGGSTAKKENHGFKMSKDGRLIITEEETSDKCVHKSKSRDSLMGNIDEIIKTDTIIKKGKKRPLEMDSDDETTPQKYRAGGSGIHRPLSAVKEKHISADAHPGTEYKAKKAGGDIKKHGKPDPYAYMPLNRTVLNKRKRAKFQGQFKGIVKSAKRGAAKGQKQKRQR